VGIVDFEKRIELTRGDKLHSNYHKKDFKY